MSSRNIRNRYFFGLGTVGRDMFYAMVSMFLTYYLTDVLNLSDATYAVVGGILTGLRIFDALNDPIMGYVVDNTKSRWGKYKPWILFGALTGAVFMVLLFTDLGVSPWLYVALFALFYLGWDILYGLNDIAYWSMLPAITLDQKQREKVGSTAKFCANVGLFAVVVGIKPITDRMAEILGIKLTFSWFLFAVAVAVLMIGFQLFTLFGVKEHRGDTFKQEEQTSLRGMVRAIAGNDQLLVATVSMGLFMIGYCTTTGFGLYFFKYAYGNADMYSIFAAVLGVSQLCAYLVFPLFSRRFTRKQLYLAATVSVVAGYVLFFFSPMNMIPIGIAGVLIFVGQAFISLLMLMFLADTIEYGQWKLGKRNQSVTFSIQPLINKIGGALSTGIMTVTLIISGINRAEAPADVAPQGLLIMKMAMLILPLVCIVAGYFVYRFKFRIDKQFYDKIVAEIAERGDIKEL
jgi:melibiose permease/lactose/raffinose/galactose permease